MAWKVELSIRVLRELDDLYGYVHASESAGAACWFTKLEGIIALLATTPHMGKRTREDPDAREIIYGNKPHQYRVIYDLDERSETVYVLSIRHGKQLPPAAPKP